MTDEGEGDFDEALMQAFIRDPNAPRPEWAFDPDRSMEEQLNETPFFMTKLPENAQDNVKLQALQALLYEGTAEEIAANFKDQGNEAFKKGPVAYKDALTFYTKGIDQKANDPLLNAQLLNNRSAVHLALKNYGFAVKDASLSISADQSNVKAFWRAGKASLALEKFTDAESFCNRGLLLFPENLDLINLLKDVDVTRRRIESERQKIEAGKAEALKIRKAMQERGVKYRVDSEKLALLELGPGIFGSDTPRVSVDENDRLIIPLVLMYPPLSQFDFIQCANEETCLLDHLTEMFAQPAPWDPGVLYGSVPLMNAYILPINETILNEESKEKSIYRLSLRTPFSRLFGSVIKCFETGMVAVYVLPTLNEKKRFEHKFKDYRFYNI